MKTFDEAFNAVCVVVEGPAESRDKILADGVEVAEERAARYREIADEIEEHEELDGLLRNMVKQHSGLASRQLVYAVFELALRIGIEMERQPLPGEPEPRRPQFQAPPRMPRPCHCKGSKPLVEIESGALIARCSVCKIIYPEHTAGIAEKMKRHNMTPEQALASWKRYEASH